MLALMLALMLSTTLVAAARIHRLTKSSPPSYVQCGIGDLDLTALARGPVISTTDWETLNFYWQPCGVLKTPILCRESNSGVCQMNSVTNEAVSIGEWDARGNVSWSLLDMRNSTADPVHFNTGATVSFQSAHANCVNPHSAGKKAFYQTSIALLCDMSGTYPVHGPLVLEENSQAPCFWSMSMRTPVACGRDAQAIVA